jgi:hypothetical protein
MANGTFPKRAAGESLISITIVLLWRGLGRAFLWRSHAEKLAATLQLLLAVSIAEEPVVANAMESTRQNVEQKPPDELVRREGHGFLFVIVAVVSPVKFHLAIFDVDDPVIGNGHAVRVTADIVHHLLWPGERGLGVDDPFLVSHWIEITGESLGILENLKGREELQLTGVERPLQIRQEQSAEQSGEHPYGQEKVGAAGDPPGTIR